MADAPQPAVNYLRVKLAYKLALVSVALGFLATFLRNSMGGWLGVMGLLIAVVQLGYSAFCVYRLNRIAGRLAGKTSQLGAIGLAAAAFLSLSLTGISLALAAQYVAAKLSDFNAKFSNLSGWTSEFGQGHVALLTQSCNAVFIATATGAVLTGLIYAGIFAYLGKLTVPLGAAKAPLRPVFVGVSAAASMALFSFTVVDPGPMAVSLGVFMVVVFNALDQIQNGMKQSTEV